MLTALLLILSAAQAPDGWRPLPSPPEAGTTKWRPAEDDAGGGDVRRVVMRSVGHDQTGAEMAVEVACAARTRTLLRAEAFDAAGRQIEAVTFPEDQRPIDGFNDGEPVWDALYAELCTAAGTR